MKNIIYIGHYRENNGLGESSRRYIDFLANNTKYNLCTRPIFLTKSTIVPYQDSDQFLEYENNSCRKYDVLIQHTFPEYVEYNNKFGKNIAIVEIETFNIHASMRVDKLNLMDEIWVNSYFAKNSLIDAGLVKPIKIIPEPYNISKLKTETDKFFTYTDNNFPFIFYTIGQYSEKKNIKSIILAYLLEFDKQDNVKLFIKTCDHRRENKDLESIIEYDTSVIKNIIRKPKNRYADIDTVCGYLSSNDIDRLHKSCNCYINTSRGDSFGASAIEAAICGNIIINTKNIGSSTYFNSSNALMINSVESPVICSNPPIKNAYSLYEKWYDPDVGQIQKAMRKAYDLTNTEIQDLKNNFNLDLFSYNHIHSLLSL